MRCSNCGDALRALGYKGDEFAGVTVGNARPARPARKQLPADGSAALLFQYSEWSDAAVRAMEFLGPLILRYHNITPSEWFEGVNAATVLGRRGSPAPRSRPLAEHTTLDSPLPSSTVRKLIEAGSSGPLSCHFSCPTGPQGKRPPDPDPLVPTVGRIVPNKRVDEVIRSSPSSSAPAGRTHRSASWVRAAGSSPTSSACRRLVDELKVRNVRFAGQVSDEEKHALYRRAAAYVCFSEHEGFGVPLVEAMRWGVPVLGAREGRGRRRRSDAGGIAVDAKSRAELAELLDLIVSDEDLRSRLRARAGESSTLRAGHRSGAAPLPSRRGRRVRVAWVVPRYGAEIGGGAETLARLTAELLADDVETTVLTTCALDYWTWATISRPAKST